MTIFPLQHNQDDGQMFNLRQPPNLSLFIIPFTAVFARVVFFTLGGTNASHSGMY